MDNICHTLTGAALGKAGLAARTPRGMATLMIAANLPDIDVGVYATNTLVMSFRRGWTHGVLAQALLPLALAGLMWLWGRRQGARFRELALLSYVGVISHVFMDWLNTYGVRLLMPFSDRWFYGDTLFVIDPWVYLMLGLGVWLTRRRERRGDPRPWRPARVALATVSVYIAVMWTSGQWARATVREGLVRAGQAPDTRFMVTPVVGNPFRREVLADVGGRYEKGFVWFDPLPHFRPAGYGVEIGLDAPEAQAALQSDRARAYLRWSRFPFAVVDRSTTPPHVFLNDYRYSDVTARAGWAAFRTPVAP